MEIEFLREFMALSETCNFQDASDRLYITNSTLSKHIRKMESEVGHPLFERSTRKVMLTDAGKILQRKSRQILTLYDDALLQMNQEAAQAGNTLSVAFTDPAYRYGILDTILAFENTHPDVTLQVTELSDPPQRSTFLERQTEFIFASDTSLLTKEIHCETFAQEEVVLVTSVDHPLAQAASLPLSAIAAEPLILPDKDFLQDLFFHACSGAGFSPDVKMYTQDFQTAFRLVSNHYASAIFPRATFEEYQENPAIRAISFAPEVTFSIYLLHMENRPFSSVGAQFFDYVSDRIHYKKEPEETP